MFCTLDQIGDQTIMGYNGINVYQLLFTEHSIGTVMSYNNIQVN